MQRTAKAAPVAPPQAVPASEAPEQPAETPLAKTARKGKPLAAIGIAAVLVLVFGAVAAIFILRKGDAPPTPVAQAPRPAPVAPPKVQVDPNKVFFEGFRVEAAAPAASVPT